MVLGPTLLRYMHVLIPWLCSYISMPTLQRVAVAMERLTGVPWGRMTPRACTQGLHSGYVTRDTSVSSQTRPVFPLSTSRKTSNPPLLSPDAESEVLDGKQVSQLMPGHALLQSAAPLQLIRDELLAAHSWLHMALGI